jgi:REP element-mobilizing transposase RayT
VEQTLIDPAWSRPLRLLAPGALYHVVARGNAKRVIYSDDLDRSRFLRILGAAVRRRRVECHAYCLMSNHYHLVLQTMEPNLSSAMQFVNGLYAQEWNKRHGQVGHVFQGRFKAQLIEMQDYFLEACRYVVLNPVRAGMVEQPENFAWSSYAATAGLVPCPSYLTTRLVGAACRDYRAFVNAATQKPEVTAALHSDAPLVGSEKFAAAHWEMIAQAHTTEVVRRHRAIGRPTLEEVFAEVHDRHTRNLRIRDARYRFHYQTSEIARHLSLHYCTVSRIVVADGRYPTDQSVLS